MGDCVLTLLRNYEPLLVLLSQEADQGDPTAIGLFQQLTSYKICALFHLMADVLSATNHLSRIFQYRDICFRSIRNSVSILRQLKVPRNLTFQFPKDFKSDNQIKYPIKIQLNDKNAYLKVRLLEEHYGVYNLFRS